MNNKYIIGSINILLMVLLYLINLFSVIKLELYSNSIIICISCIFIFITIGSLITYLSKNKNIYNITQFVSFLINIILIFNIYNIENNYNYYSNIFTNKYKYVEYKLYVQKKNTIYNNVYKLKDKNISIVTDSNSLEDFIKKENISVNKCENIVALEESLSSGKAQAILLNEQEYKNLSEGTKSKIKVISKSKIKIEKNV